MSSYYFQGQSVPTASTNGTFSGNVTVGGTLAVTGVSQFAAGTAGAPGVGVGGATDGVFRASAGVMGLTGSGVEVARFSATVAQIPAAAGLFWNGRSQIISSADNKLQLLPNAGGGSTFQLVFNTLDTNGSKIRNNGGGIFNFEDGQATGVAAQCRAGQWFNPNGTYGLFFNTSSTFGNGGNSATTTLGLATNSLTAMSIGSTQNVSFHGTGGVSGNSGASTNIKSVTAQTTLSGATTNLVQIPAGAIVLAVAARVTTAITSGDGATTWTFGDGTTADLFGTGLAFTANTTVTNTAYKSTFTHKVYTSATNTVATATGGTFSGGVVRTVVYYLDVTAPTS
jgi:hypothetical protein